MNGDTAAYNRFFRDHEDLYVGARSKAPLAIILDDSSAGVPLLDGLAARRVLFEILYEKDVTIEALSRYKAVAVLTARVVRGSAVSALEAFVRKGGYLIRRKRVRSSTSKEIFAPVRRSSGTQSDLAKQSILRTFPPWRSSPKLCEQLPEMLQSAWKRLQAFCTTSRSRGTGIES